MRETIPLAIGMLLAVYGAAQLLWHLACRLLCDDGGNNGYLVIPMSGNREDAEYHARRTALLRGYGFHPIVLDTGLTPESATLTEEVCRRLRVDFVAEKEWQKMLENALQEPKSGV